MKKSVTIEYSDAVLLALGISPEQFAHEAAFLTALKLYELGRLSAGAAAELAGMPKPLFLNKLSQYGADTFDLSREEIESEIACGRRHQ